MDCADFFRLTFWSDFLQLGRVPISTNSKESDASVAEKIDDLVTKLNNF
jgi:hypothetical protein